MVTKVSSVYRVDIQKQGHRHSKDGDKKKPEVQFRDVLAKNLMSSSGKAIG